MRDPKDEQAAGLQDGDTITAVRVEPKAATERAFALWCPFHVMELNSGHTDTEMVVTALESKIGSRMCSRFKPQTEHLLLVCQAAALWHGVIMGDPVWGGSVYSKFRKAHKRTRSCETMSLDDLHEVAGSCGSAFELRGCLA